MKSEHLPISFSKIYVVLTPDGQFAGVSSEFCQLNKCSLQELVTKPNHSVLRPFQQLLPELAISQQAYKIKLEVQLAAHLKNYVVEVIVSPRLLFFVLVPPLPQPPVKAINLEQFNLLLHDLHNLLGCVIANRQLLSADLAAPEANQLLQTMKLANSKAEELLLSSLRQLPKQTLFSINNLIAEVLATMKPALGKIVCQVSAPQAKVTFKDGGATFNRILLNLLLNSCNALRRRDGSTKEIIISVNLVASENLPLWLSTCKQGEQQTEETSSHLTLSYNNLPTKTSYFLELEVQDNGSGTQLHQLSGLVANRNQVPPTSGSHGFGLASVRALLLEKGGWRLQSTFGSGTTFSCFLPIETPLPLPSSVR